jgi:hypothetical protein
MTKEYEAALNAVREATAKYNAVSKAYRLGTIGDEEFLLAQEAYKEAEKVFDVVYAKEEGNA